MKLEKMYYKKEDLTNSYFNNVKLVVTSKCYGFVRVIGLGGQCAIEFIYDKGDNNYENEIRVFKTIQEFNTFVKFERWLND